MSTTPSGKRAHLGIAHVQSPLFLKLTAVTKGVCNTRSLILTLVDGLRLPPVCRQRTRASVARPKVQIVVFGGVAKGLRFGCAVEAVELRREGRSCNCERKLPLRSEAPKARRAVVPTGLERASCVSLSAPCCGACNIWCCSLRRSQVRRNH